MAVLLLLTLTMSFNANAVFATSNITDPNQTIESYNQDLSPESGKNTVPQTAKPVTTKANSSNTNYAAGSPTSSTYKVTFSNTQINSASSRVKSFIDTNYRLPNQVTISNIQVSMPQFLQLAAGTLLNYNGQKMPLTLQSADDPISPVEDVKAGTLSKSEYLSLAQTITKSIDATGRAPDYVNSTLGKIRYESLIYTFSKILNYQNTYQKLPSTVSVNPWTVISSPITPPEGGSRPVYIVSDNINGLSQDKARIDSIISGLAKLGITAYNYGIGPQTHLTVLSSKKVPNNALIVEIAGGADAGAILEKTSSWYKNLMGSRKNIVVFTNGAKKITGLTWLERAHDDNYSPRSFKGLSHPDQVLLNNGYQYFEGLTNSNINQLVQTIFNTATSG